MAQPKCPRCHQSIMVDDTVSFDSDAIAHLDCRRPRDLSHEERALLFRYCFDHVVAECANCAKKFRQQELASDLMGNRTHLCPGCRADLTNAVRSHLYACAMLPSEVQRRAREVREAARKLIKQSQELSNCADVLMREAEAAIAALRETMTRMAGG